MLTMGLGEHVVPLDILPSEVWETIFQNLQLRDRRHVRLACSQFYELCNVIRFLDNEIIYIHDNCNLNAIVQTLCKSRRKLWHLSLHNISLVDGKALLFFEKHGSNIHSLSINQCEFAPGIFENIILFCEALRGIRLNFELPVRPDYVRPLFDDFITLQTRSIIRENMTTFELTVPFFVGVLEIPAQIESCTGGLASIMGLRYQFNPINLLSNRKFLSFFNVFPNVKRLLFTCNDLLHEGEFYEVSLNPEDLLSDAKFTLTSINDCLLNNADHFEGLELSFYDYDDDPIYMSSGIYSVLGTVTTKLSHLKELSLKFSSDEENLLANSIAQLKHLTSIKLCIKNEHILPGAYLVLLLNNLSELRYLSLDIESQSLNESHENLDLTFELFRALVTSKLTTFFISGQKLRKIQYFAVEEYISPNYTLTNLKLSFKSAQTACLLLFTEYFRVVKHLEFFHDSDIGPIFENITNYQIHLRTLIILQEPTDAYFADVDAISLHRLERLEYLELTECTDNWIDERILFTSDQFPNLKYLKAKFESIDLAPEAEASSCKSYQYKFTRMIRQLSQLEAVYFWFGCETTLSMWLELCETLPSLRYLYICDITEKMGFEDNEYRMCFEKCTSLRLLIHSVNLPHIERETLAIYIQDTITGTVMKMSDTPDAEIFMPTPRIGSCIVCFGRNSFHMKEFKSLC